MKIKYLIPLLLLSVIVAQSIYLAHQQDATRAVIQAQAATIAAYAKERSADTAQYLAMIAALRAELLAVSTNLNQVVQTLVINHGESTDPNISNIIIQEPAQPSVQTYRHP